MAKTQRINDFTINLGRSSRRNVHTEMLESAQKLVDQADISNLSLQFERGGAPLGNPVLGKMVGKRTAISIVADKKLKKYGLKELADSARRIPNRTFWCKKRKCIKALKKTRYQTTRSTGY
jgi:hypothetical protein